MPVEPDPGGSVAAVQPGQLIPWDASAAEDVARQLVTLAMALGQGSSQFSQAAYWAAQHWTGKFRVSFDTWSAQYMTQAPQLADLLIQWATDIRAASIDVQGYNNLVATAPNGKAPKVPDPTTWAGL